MLVLGAIALPLYFIVQWYQMDIARLLFSKYGVIFHNKNATPILTIDDAPYSTNSFKEILNVLDKYNCKASFFVIASYVNDENFNYLVDAVNNGHHLANHGYKNTMHVLHWDESIRNEINKCEDVIDKVYAAAKVKKHKQKYFRPGWGALGDVIHRFAEKNKYKIVLGSNYPTDPHFPLPGLYKRYVMNHFKANDIIILHDRSWTPQTLEQILSELAAQGITTKSLTDLDA